MPKIVDHEQRRREIVAALMRVISRDGFAGASVRNVALEAGVSPGSLRHYFATQASLVLAAAESMTESVAARVQARAATAATLGDWAGVLEQIVPLDAQRRTEFEVWLDLINEGRTDPALRALSVASHHAIRQLCDDVLGALGLPRKGRSGAATALHGLLDGLSLHLVLYPDALTPARARAALRDQLASLVAA